MVPAFRTGLDVSMKSRICSAANLRGRSRIRKGDCLARRLIDEAQSVREIADTFNFHTATIYWLSKTAA